MRAPCSAAASAQHVLHPGSRVPGLEAASHLSDPVRETAGASCLALLAVTAQQRDRALAHSCCRTAALAQLCGKQVLYMCQQMCRLCFLPEPLLHVLTE